MKIVVGALAPVASVGVDGSCVLVQTDRSGSHRLVEADNNVDQFLQSLQYNVAKEVWAVLAS
jgi:hypothetical protein